MCAARTHAFTVIHAEGTPQELKFGDEGDVFIVEHPEWLALGLGRFLAPAAISDKEDPDNPGSADYVFVGKPIRGTPEVLRRRINEEVVAFGAVLERLAEHFGRFPAPKYEKLFVSLAAILELRLPREKDWIDIRDGALLLAGWGINPRNSPGPTVRDLLCPKDGDRARADYLAFLRHTLEKRYVQEGPTDAAETPKPKSFPDVGVRKIAFPKAPARTLPWILAAGMLALAAGLAVVATLERIRGGRLKDEVASVRKEMNDARTASENDVLALKGKLKKQTSEATTLKGRIKKQEEEALALNGRIKKQEQENEQLILDLEHTRLQVQELEKAAASSRQVNDDAQRSFEDVLLLGAVEEINRLSRDAQRILASKDPEATAPVEGWFSRLNVLNNSLARRDVVLEKLRKKADERSIELAAKKGAAIQARAELARLEEEHTFLSPTADPAEVTLLFRATVTSPADNAPLRIAATGWAGYSLRVFLQGAELVPEPGAGNGAATFVLPPPKSPGEKLLLAFGIEPPRDGLPALRFSVMKAGDDGPKRLNASWRFREGTRDVVQPSEDWAAPGIDDSSWSKGRPPFVIGGETAQRRTSVSAKIVEIETRVEPLAAELGSRLWIFPDSKDQWFHDSIEKLADTARKFQTDVCQKMDDYRREQKDFARKWQDAIARIGRATEPSVYGSWQGRETFARQKGLLPLGCDHSGLEEFLVRGSGRPPTDEGKSRFNGETGIVFVLVPGGIFRPGDPATGTKGASPASPEDEKSLLARLAPFFIAKHELTRGQWSRLVGTTGAVNADATVKLADLSLPVTGISWSECQKVLSAHDLALPTEAQWEYAARGGTVTEWWCGDDPTCLQQKENLADLSWKNAQPKPDTVPSEDWDDHYAGAAPVAQFEANPFGLYDVIGNVRELCRDVYGEASSRRPLQEGSGERTATGDVGDRAVRGGSYMDISTRAWVRTRDSIGPEKIDTVVGIRPVRAVSPGNPR